jgi:hypothetical protein
MYLDELPSARVSDMRRSGALTLDMTHVAVRSRLCLSDQPYDEGEGGQPLENPLGARATDYRRAANSG